VIILSSNSQDFMLLRLFRLFLYEFLVRAIAEGPVGRPFTVAQPVFFGLRDVEANGLELDLEVDVPVRAIAERLALALATQAPHVILAAFETHLERLSVVYHSVTGL